MKIFIDEDNYNYIEVKKDDASNVVLSIRTKTEEKKSLVITAKIEPNILDKLISELVLLKSKVIK